MHCINNRNYNSVEKRDPERVLIVLITATERLRKSKRRTEPDVVAISTNNTIMFCVLIFLSMLNCLNIRRWLYKHVKSLVYEEYRVV